MTNGAERHLARRYGILVCVCCGRSIDVLVLRYFVFVENDGKLYVVDVAHCTTIFGSFC